MNMPSTRAEFDAAFPDEAAAESWLFSIRWPNGPVCTRCHKTNLVRLRTRPRLWHCRDCSAQTSLRSGTIMHGSRRPLRDWIYAMWVCASRAGGMTAAGVMRDLQIPSYETAFRMLHKVRASLEEKATWMLRGPSVHLAFGWFAPTRHAKGDPDDLARILVGVGAEVSSVAMVPNDLRLCAMDRETPEPEQAAAELVSGIVAPGVEPHLHLKLPVWSATGENQPQLEFGYANFLRFVHGWFGGVSARYLGNYFAQYLYRFNRQHIGDQLLDCVGRRALADPFSLIEFGTVPVIGTQST